MKKITFLRIVTLLLAVVMLTAALPMASADSINAKVSPQKVMVNEQYVKLSAYNIDGSNYFRLRDLAVYFKGTEAQFSVDYSGNTMYIVRGGEYEAIGTELATLSTPKKISESIQKIRIDGQLFKIDAYNIDGSNYFKLRDLTDLGFEVYYEEEIQTVSIITTGEYTNTHLFTPLHIGSGDSVEVGGSLRLGVSIDAGYSSSGLTVTASNDNVSVSCYNYTIYVTGVKEGTSVITLENSTGDKAERSVKVSKPTYLTDLPSTSISLNCDAIDYANVTVTNNSDYTIKFSIEPGTYLRSGSSSCQNLLVTSSVSGEIPAGSSKTFTVNTCCMNIHKDIPSGNKNYSVGKTDNQLLIKLCQYFAENSTTYAVRQAATWIITDNATYSDCGILVSGLVRVIAQDDYDEAAAIVKSLK